jgi:hypothetical protein
MTHGDSVHIVEYFNEDCRKSEGMVGSTFSLVVHCSLSPQDVSNKTATT